MAAKQVATKGKSATPTGAKSGASTKTKSGETKISAHKPASKAAAPKAAAAKAPAPGVHKPGVHKSAVHKVTDKAVKATEAKVKSTMSATSKASAHTAPVKAASAKPAPAKAAPVKAAAVAKPAPSKAKPVDAPKAAAKPQVAPAAKPAVAAATPKHAPAPVAAPRPMITPRPLATGATAAATRPSHGPAPVAALPRDVIDKAAIAKQLEARQAEAAKKKPLSSTQRHGFKVGEYVVYPSHGVGKIVLIEEQVVAGHALELFVINFEHEKMTLRVPTAKLAAVGMRKLAEDGVVRRAMDTLRGRARVKRTMWSRRAQEYENKINSGDLVSISEVVRDLYRAETQPEQSYSERQLFEAALDRMSREIAAVEKLDERGAVQKITEVLSKSAKGRATKATEDAAAAVAAAGDAEERAA